MNIVAPYRSGEIDVIKETNKDVHDNVERAGYIRPEDRIKTFIETGQLLQSHAIGGEFDMQESETEAEPDSPEYVEELTEDAANFEEAPLSQYMDRMTASEILSEADKQLENAKISEKRDKSRKSEKDASKEFLEALRKEISEGVSEAIATKDKPVE